MSLLKHVPLLNPPDTFRSRFSFVADEQSSGGLSGLAGVGNPNKVAGNSSSNTNDRNNFNKSASLELILSPIIQSRR